MKLIEKNCAGFAEALASGEPVPGGGGASALAGVLGASLASMVCNLTAGKKKYAEFEEDIQAILAEADSLRNALLELVDGDAEAFEPLSRAYSIPKDEPGRDAVMEAALKTAAKPPLEIMRLSARAIELHAQLVIKGSRLMISDVGVGAACCRSALQGAALSVYINTASMLDRNCAGEMEREAEELLNKYEAMADEVYATVMKTLI